VKRGEDELSQGNVLAARRFFLRAAEAGNAAAAFKLGETHDPVELQRWQVHGVMADLTVARTWYQRALELGMAEAAPRLARLGN
jgi:TPR repeat protein